MTRDELMEMVNKARSCYLGLWGPHGIVYIGVSKKTIKKKAGEIIGCGLTVEIGDDEDGLSDVLYIESRRQGSE
jgi:hypothetical protein